MDTPGLRTPTTSQHGRRRQVLVVDVLMLLLGLAWGYTFVLTKYVIEAIPVLQYLGTRFLIAGLLLGAFIWRRHRQRLRKKELLFGLAAGVLLSAGYSLQTFGIEYTSPGMAGMITELTTVMTPFFAFLLISRPLKKAEVVGAMLACVGGVVMEWQGHHFAVSLGNLLVLGCDFAFCFHLLFVDKTVHRVDPTWFVVTQLSATGVILSIAGFATAPLPAHVSGFQWFGYTFELFIGTIAAYLIQINAQRLTNPTHFTILTSIEGPASMFFSWLQWGEIITPVKVVGAGVLFAGVVVTEWFSGRPTTDHVVADAAVSPDA